MKSPTLPSSRGFQIGLGLTLSALSLYLAFRDVQLQDVWKVISQSHSGYIFLTLLIIAANSLVKAWRWRTLLGPPARHIGLGKITMSHVAGQMLNTLFPLRVGEISRMVVIGDMGVGRVFVLGTIAVEKLLDMIAYALLFMVLLFLIPMPEWLGGSAFAFLGVTALISLVVFWVTLKREWVVGQMERLSKRLPQPFRETSFAGNGIGSLHSGLESLAVLQRRADLLVLALSTAMVWATALAVIHILLVALDINIPLRASLLVLIALQAGVSLPSAPAKIGVFEFACVLALSIFGITQANSLSYGILLHAILFLPIIMLGLIFYWVLVLKPKPGDGRQAIEED